jgi:phospholipid/cholesterol/gamma-HCH transport system permease protein
LTWRHELASLAAVEARRSAAELSFDRARDGVLTIRVAGSWQLRRGIPSALAAEREISRSPAPRRVAFDAQHLEHWDSSLVNFLTRVEELCRSRRIEIEREGLPEGLQRLAALAEAVPEKTGARTIIVGLPFLDRLGTAALHASHQAGEHIEFIGEVTAACINFARGRARFRSSDLMLLIQQCGADALGIVTLISFLVGVILAFMGAVILERFGAAIYIADLVAVGTVREMGAMMTAIIMSGRTGAAFAAQLGTMKVTQEIDALTTMGISPLEFLVLPRMIALVLMLPLLCLYADMVGILGGGAIGAGMLGLSLRTYLHQAAHAVSYTDLWGGLLKGTTYGALIAYAGCLRGFQCGNSSSAVGDAATAAVVTAIVMIVSACGIYAVIFHILKI